MHEVIYIALHVGFGFITGSVFAYLRKPGVPKKARWLAYALGIGLCLPIAGAIGEASKRWDISENSEWIGIASIPLAFILAIATSRLVERARRP